MTLSDVRSFFAESLSDRFLTGLGNLQMQRAARRLPPLLTQKKRGPVEIHFFTGDEFWHQTCFCAYSLLLHSPALAGVVFHGDASLKREQVATLRRIFPDVQFNSFWRLKPKLDSNFPEETFPAIHQGNRHHIVMRKLTVVHGGDSSGWKLCVDSDMIFFKKPTLLLDWLNSPTVPCYMQGREREFGYSEEAMSGLVDGEIPATMNTGIFGFNTSAIDWKRMEYWAQSLLNKGGLRYLIEQALSGLLVAGKPYLELPNSDYHLCPTVAEAIKPTAVMHHYAGHTRPLLFRYAWRHLNIHTAGG